MRQTTQLPTPSLLFPSQEGVRIYSPHAILTRKQTNEVKADSEKFRYISTKSTFDYLTDECKFYNLSFRIVRFPLSQDSYECIITNLPQDEFDASELKKLYQLRWGRENSFR